MDNYFIVEQFTESKSGIPSENEDGLLTGRDFIAVVDGATSKDDRSFSEGTSGQIIRNIIIRMLGTLRKEATAKEAVQIIQDEIVKYSELKNISRSMTASAVIYSVYRRELWMVGDCQALINGVPIENKKRIDELLSEVRALAIYAYLEQGYTPEELQDHDYGRELILPFLKLQHLFENKRNPFGYGVFNNEPLKALKAEDIVKVIPVDKKAEIVLASDGYPILKETLEGSEQTLRDVIEKDPLCFQMYPSTKGVKTGNQSYDDRSYIRFRICEEDAL